jgi:kynurenine formamidase
LIKTGFSRFRNDREETYIFHNPGLAPDLGQWIRTNTKIRMIGFDFISLSSYAHRGLGREAHLAFLASHGYEGKGIDPVLIMEDMDLSKIIESPKQILVSPLRFERADGAPITVFGYY